MRLSFSLCLVYAISESKCSSFIYYSICFTPLFLCFHIQQLAKAHLVELYLFLGVFLFLASQCGPFYVVSLTSEDTEESALTIEFHYGGLSFPW